MWGKSVPGGRREEDVLVNDETERGYKKIEGKEKEQEKNIRLANENPSHHGDRVGW